ncbi:hypothetical protein ACFQT4_00455 [Pseudoduganella danionis]
MKEEVTNRYANATASREALSANAKPQIQTAVRRSMRSSSPCAMPKA